MEAAIETTARGSQHAPGEELELSLGAGPTVRASSFSGSATVTTR